MPTPQATSLEHFQDAFTRALSDPDNCRDATVAALAAQPAFAVYRNTVMKGCVDALVANFPAVMRVAGEDWFRAAAAMYARANPPAHPALLDYGASFADFLECFEPAAELPYLPGVARLDRLWTEAHAAATLAPLAPAALAALAPEALGHAVLHPHPAARWAWFADAPAFTIWSRNRGGHDLDAELEWLAEGALIVRPHDSIAWLALDSAGCAFLDACAAGEPLGTAAGAALSARADADIAQLMASLLAAGAFGAMAAAGTNQQEATP